MDKLNTCKIKICIVDDHELFRIGMRSILNDIPNIKIIYEASNGIELLKKIETNLPDIIFMDINMPILNGIETTSIIREKYPNIKIIVLTAYNEASCFKKMVNMRIQGFINKSASKLEILTALNHVINGLTYISSDLFDIISEIIITKNNFSPHLSKREIEIIELLYQGLDTREIANNLYLSQRTIEKHKYNMMEKINVKNTVQLVVYAIKQGIIKTE